MTAAEASRRSLVFAPRVRILRILWRLVPWVGLAGLLVFGAWVLGATGRGLGQLAWVGVTLVGYGLILAVITEIFSPDRPALRLIPISDLRARRLAMTLRGLFFFMLLTSAGVALIEANQWHTGVADVLRIVQRVVIVLAGAAIITTTGLHKGLRDAEGPGLWATIGRFTGRVVFPALVLTLLFHAVASGLGYVPLADWFAENAFWTVVKVLGAVLLYRWLRRALRRMVRFYRSDEHAEDEDEEGAGLHEADTVGLGMERVGGGLMKLAVIVLTAIWVLSGWNLPPGAILQALQSPIGAGGATTWGQIVGGILSVVTVLFAGWFLKNVLIYFVFPKSKVGVGARYAILAVLRYVVIAVAAVFALGVIGVDTSSLGWFFGAAGIGIGLGLQDIIGNFISGLIMLVERPIRVGDTVQVGQTMGKVENIRMRGTVLRTFDNTTVLIPNNQMLGERVTNLSHSMHNVRMRIPVGVSYGADPSQVKEILLQTAKDNPRVLEDPEPNVLFDGFGASSIDFFLVCYTSELGGRLGISSELRFEIFRRLGEEDIEIPFPQTDLHIRSGLPPWEPPSAPGSDSTAPQS